LSLIICYVGSNGTVIIGDKRRIDFLGNRKKRELLEEELYSGSIKTEESLIKRAEELDITLKIDDNASKVREIGDVVVGEVKTSTPMETKRKRIYGTTGSYSLLELSGSTIKNMKTGDASIVFFGNKMTKELASKTVKKYWKNKVSLKDVADVFKKSAEEVSKHTPSVSRDYDIITKNPTLNKKQSRELLRSTIIQDVKNLEKWRSELKEQMEKAAKSIAMSSKIMENGTVGKVRDIKGNKVDITLSEGIEAHDLEWNLKAKPGEVVTMEVDEPEMVSVGDLAVVEHENLCIMRTKCGLKCDVILCRQK